MDTLPYNSVLNNNIRYNSGQIIAITFHCEYKIIVKRKIVSLIMVN